MSFLCFLKLAGFSTRYLISSPSRSFLYVAISMSRASFTFISSWYWRTCRAMSCLALCRASSRSRRRSLASFTASSPRSSASAIWASRLFLWRQNEVQDKKGFNSFYQVHQVQELSIKWKSTGQWKVRVKLTAWTLTCALTISISDWSLMILRFMSAISALVDFRSSSYLPADFCISAYCNKLT